MSPPLINSSYTADGLLVTTLNVTACIQDAEEKIALYETLFNFGAVFPILVWPLLPSTSEINNYRILAFTSITQLVLMLLWTAYCRTNDGLCCHRGFQIWEGYLLYCCFLLGLEGRKAEKLGRSLQREGFKDAAWSIFGLLFTVMGMGGSYLLDSLVREPMNLGGGLDIVLMMGVVTVIWFMWKPFTELAMTIVHRFTARRFTALYWLPQNGAQSDFEPWWSCQLRFAVPGYTLFLLYVLLAAIDVGGTCRLCRVPN